MDIILRNGSISSISALTSSNLYPVAGIFNLGSLSNPNTGVVTGPNPMINGIIKPNVDKPNDGLAIHQSSDGQNEKDMINGIIKPNVDKPNGGLAIPQSSDGQKEKDTIKVVSKPTPDWHPVPTSSTNLRHPSSAPVSGTHFSTHLAPVSSTHLGPVSSTHLAPVSSTHSSTHSSNQY